MMRHLHHTFLIATLFLSLGCTTKSSQYALVSTKESGVFQKSSQLTASPESEKPYDIIVRIRFTNESWFPLSKEEMTSAVKDNLLEKLSASGLFRFVNSTGNAVGDQAIGYLDIDVSLLESIQTVKVTITLQVPSDATYVASVHGTLANKSSKEIFNEFRSVGDRAGDSINHKLRLLK